MKQISGNKLLVKALKENQRIAARNHAKHDSFASRSVLLVTEGTVTR